MYNWGCLDTSGISMDPFSRTTKQYMYACKLTMFFLIRHSSTSIYCRTCCYEKNPIDQERSMCSSRFVFRESPNMLGPMQLWQLWARRLSDTRLINELKVPRLPSLSIQLQFVIDHCIRPKKKHMCLWSDCFSKIDAGARFFFFFFFFFFLTCEIYKQGKEE